MKNKALAECFKVCKGILIVFLIFYICGTFQCSRNKNILSLINRLDNNNWRIRAKAAEELEDIGKPALDSLLYALKNKNRDIRKEIPEILVWIKDPTTINPIINALSDNDWRVAKAVENSLEILEDQAVGPLIPLLERSNDSTKIRVIRLISRIAASISEEERKNKQLKVSARCELGRAVPSLTVLLEDKNPAIRANALEALQEIKDPNPIATIIPRLRDDNLRVRIQAVRTFGRLGGTQAVELLIGLLSDNNWQVRMEAIAALGLLKNKQAVIPLIKCLQDKNWRIRHRAIVALEILKDERAVVPLVEVYKKENNLIIKRLVIYALREIANAQTIDFLTSVLSNKDRHIIENAVYALERIGKPALKNLIAVLKRRDINIGLYVCIIEALGDIGDKRAVEPLINALSHNYPYIRKKAVIELERFKDPRTLGPLLNTLKDKDRDVRRRALSIFINTKDDPTTIETLKRIAKNHPDDDVRKAALWVVEDINKNIYEVVERFDNGKIKIEDVYKQFFQWQALVKRRHYNERGQLIKSEDLMNYTTTYFSYYKEGFLRSQTSYQIGWYHGKLIEWDKNGHVIQEEIWENGKLVKKIK